MKGKIGNAGDKEEVIMRKQIDGRENNVKEELAALTTNGEKEGVVGGKGIKALTEG